MQHKGYEVQFIDSNSFDQLPYKGATEALGLCDKSSKQVFVRDTGNQTMDIFSVAHELEHLEGNDMDEHEDPDEPGVYYKKASSWILPAIIGASFLIPGVGPAVSGALSSVGGGISGALGAIPGVGGALSGAAQSIGGAAGSLLGIGGTGQAGSAAADRALLQGSASPAPFVSRVRSASAPFGSGGQTAALGAGAGAGAAAMSGFGKSAASQVGTTLASNAASSFMSPRSPMSEFMPEQPSFSMAQGFSQSPASPATSAIGGNGVGAEGGDTGQGTVGKMRNDQELVKSAMKQRQRGFYAGRDAGNF